MNPKLVLAVALLAALLGCSQEARICRRMERLCGTTRAECRESVRAARQAQGEEGVDELARCYAEADSCAQARGCEAAVAFKGAASQLGDFFESFSKGMEDDEDEN